MFPSLMHPTAGQYTAVGRPIKFSEMPELASAPAPGLGAHTRATLSELLEADSAALDKWENAGVILKSVKHC